MPKIQFSDVTPPEKKRSIRDVPIPNGGKRKIPIPIRSQVKPEVEPIQNEKTNFDSKMLEITEKKNEGPYEYYYPKNKEIKEPLKDFNDDRKKQWIIGGIILILIGVFIVSMMTIFSSATIKITPKSQEIGVNTNITANNKIENGVVKYEIIKLTNSKTTLVKATGEEVVELKSSGKIIIYNDFSSEPQRLIIRTRFESPEGLIYRIPESIVVPGKTTKDGVTTSGSIEVEVFADEAGEKYNIKKTDFTIPGFKNDTARYKGFYARGVTEMTGGFIGKMKKIEESEKEIALQDIQSKTEEELKKDLKSKIPEGLILLSGSIKYESRELTPTEESSSVVIGKEVTAYAIMLNKKDLSDKIIEENTSNLVDWTNLKPIIKDFSDLEIINLSENTEIDENIKLNIIGKAEVVADININVINQRLLGAPKKEAAKLIDDFPGISSIEATIKPIWKKSFPKDPKKIYVQTTDL